jgi:hypothetical protein
MTKSGCVRKFVTIVSEHENALAFIFTIVASQVATPLSGVGPPVPVNIGEQTSLGKNASYKRDEVTVSGSFGSALSAVPMRQFVLGAPL